MEYLIIGKIVNTHGVRGELRVQPLTDNIDRFGDLNTVYLGSSKEAKTLKSYRLHKSFVLIKFKEHEDINEVLKYKNQYIYINIEDRVSLPEDSYFIYELLDMKVYDMDDNYLGEISDVLQGLSNDVYIIKKTDGGEAMIPAVKEFIKNIDLENKKMSISPIEGMI